MLWTNTLFFKCFIDTTFTTQILYKTHVVFISLTNECKSTMLCICCQIGQLDTMHNFNMHEHWLYSLIIWSFQVESHCSFYSSHECPILICVFNFTSNFPPFKFIFLFLFFKAHHNIITTLGPQLGTFFIIAITLSWN